MPRSKHCPHLASRNIQLFFFCKIPFLLCLHSTWHATNQYHPGISISWLGSERTARPLVALSKYLVVPISYTQPASMEKG